MALEVAREGSEPSLFFAVTKQDDNTLSVVGWYLHPDLPELFKLEVYKPGSEGPLRVAHYLCQFREGQAKHQNWKHPVVLEIRREFEDDA